MSAKTLLRPATLDDMTAVQEIYAHYVLHSLATYEEEVPDLDEMCARFKAITEAGFPYIVAVEDDQVVGYAYASSFRTRSAYRFTVENSIYLDPKACGRGLGRLLLDQLIILCRVQKYEQMIAVIGDSANHASIALHAKANFDMIGTMPATGFKFNRWVDTVIMQLALQKAD